MPRRLARGATREPARCRTHRLRFRTACRLRDWESARHPREESFRREWCGALYHRPTWGDQARNSPARMRAREAV